MEPVILLRVGSPEYDNILEAAAKAGYQVGFEQGKAMGEDQIGDVKKAAEWVGVGKQTIYNRINSGQIPYNKVGGLVRFSKKEINDWMMGRKSKNKW